MRQDKGVITVFLALIFSIIFTFLCVTVDITRINSTKNQLIVAVDAAITSTLSKFNTKLYEDYGIMVFDSNEVDEGQFKSIIDENVSKNNLFNINVENVSIETGGSPFTDNDIMKKQMVLSMKYQGTENLARSVFDKIKQFLNLGDIAKDNDLIKDIEEDNIKEKLDNKISVMQAGKLDALRAVIALAKNNKYDVVNGKEMYYRSSITEKHLRGIYQSNESVIMALDSKAINPYVANTYLQRGYSYAYTLTILKMYSTHLDSIAKDIPSQDETDSSDSDETDNNDSNINNELKKIEKRKSIINKIIDNIEDSDGLAELKKSESSLIKELNTYMNGTSKFLVFGKKGGIQNAIDAVNDLKNNKEKYLTHLRQYNNVTSDELRETSKQTLEEYEALLDNKNLNDTINQLEQVKKLITDLKMNIEPMLQNLNQNVIQDSISWAKNNSNSRIFERIDELLGENITANSNINDIVIKISQDKTLLSYQKATGIAKSINQIDTLAGLNLDTNIMGLEYKENADKYKSLFDKFKNNKDNPNLKDLVKKYYTSNASIKSSNLPNGQNTEDLDKYLDKILNKKTSSDIGKISGLKNFNDLTSVLDGMGDFADKLYLVEYIMTNFKDITDPSIGNPDLERIPEETKKSTTLEYEIEAIISGYYDDSKSKLTMANEIFATRFAMNTISLVKDNEVKMKVIKTISNAISVASQGVIPVPLAKYTMIAGWVTIETRYDVIDTLLGYDVELIKDNDNWISNFGLDKNTANMDKDSLLEVLNKENVEIGDSNPGPYNEQDKIDGISLNYPDYLRFKLLTMDSQKMINSVQDLIVENEKIHSSYKNYSTEIEATVNESNVNILFNTEYFTDNKNNFNKFKFKRGYN